MSVVIICFSGHDVINFEVKLSFLIRLFSYMTKKVRKENCYEWKELSYEIESVFHYFYRTFIEANKTNFLEDWNSSLSIKVSSVMCVNHACN